MKTSAIFAILSALATAAVALPAEQAEQINAEAAGDLARSYQISWCKKTGYSSCDDYSGRQYSKCYNVDGNYRSVKYSGASDCYYYKSKNCRGNDYLEASHDYSSLPSSYSESVSSYYCTQ